MGIKKSIDLWVNVKDSLPEEGEYVMVFGGGAVQHQTYFHEECMVRGCSMWFCYSEDADPVPMSGVTHWMPLPSKPVADIKQIGVE